MFKYELIFEVDLGALVPEADLVCNEINDLLAKQDPCLPKLNLRTKCLSVKVTSPEEIAQEKMQCLKDLTLAEFLKAWPGRNVKFVEVRSQPRKSSGNSE